ASDAASPRAEQARGLAGLAADAWRAAARAADAAGWPTGEAGGRALVSELHEQTLARQLGDPDLAELARAALPALPAQDPRRAAVLRALGRTAEAAVAYREA